MGTVAVVGSINMDMTVMTQRIPRKGETIQGEDLRYMPGGKGANQAVAIAKLGGKVEMFGCVGNDASGKVLTDNLAAAGVGTNHVCVTDKAPSGIAFITVGEDDNTIVIVAGANNYVDIQYIDSVKDQLLMADVILLQNEIPQETNEYVIRLGHENKKSVILNPAPARAISAELMEKVRYITPNEHESDILFAAPLHNALCSYPDKLIVTQGKAGVSVCLQSGQVMQIPAVEAKVVDTTGAGDTLNGAFAFMIAADSSVVDALRFANCAASCSVEKLGAQGGMPNYDQVMKRMDAYRDGNQ